MLPSWKSIEYRVFLELKYTKITISSSRHELLLEFNIKSEENLPSFKSTPFGLQIKNGEKFSFTGARLSELKLRKQKFLIMSYTLLLELKYKNEEIPPHVTYILLELNFF